MRHFYTAEDALWNHPQCIEVLFTPQMLSAIDYKVETSVPIFRKQWKRFQPFPFPYQLECTIRIQIKMLLYGLRVN